MNSLNIMIDREALFTDETENFRIPSEPEAFDQVVLRFRTAINNVDRVYLVLESLEVEMEKSYSDTWFDYYTTYIRVDSEPVHYHFEVIKGNECCHYNKLGPVNELVGSYRFCINPGFKTPGWAKGAVMYQIFVDRFCNGDKTNDTVDQEYFYVTQGTRHIEDWNELPAPMDIGNFYGGDLQGVWNKLDYLKYLGIEAIYFNPIFVSPSTHKYDVEDYDYIDPHFGLIIHDGGEPLPRSETDNRKASKYIARAVCKENLKASNEFFIKFVEAAHSRGIKIILDGVFNHCGSFHKWLDRELIYEDNRDYSPGAYVSKESPYRDYFKFHNDQWPYNNSYDGWWGHDTLPKLNYEGSKELYEEILRIGVKWVSPPYNVDGWRLDVAADLGHSLSFNHQLWKDFRKAVKKANPEALILAEHYGDASSWLQGDEWDTIMNYDAFMEPITWFLTGMEKHSDEYNNNMYGNGDAFFYAMSHQSSRMHNQSLQVAMNQLSNHDHSRFLTRTNKTVGRIATVGAKAAAEGISKGVMCEAVVIQMTWPGAPTIYYGDEAGLCGWTDPDNRRSYPWGNEDLELQEFHRYMILYRKTHIALRIGSLKPLLSSDHLISYGRFYQKDILVVIVNNKDEVRDVKVPVWQVGITDENKLVRIMSTNRETYNIGRLSYFAEQGYLNIRMAPISSVLFCVEE